MVYNVMGWLADAAYRFADAPAFADAEGSVTFGALYAKVCRAGTAISKRLENKTRRPVAVLIDRSKESVSAFLSVAASGNFYVPLDCTLPEIRIKSILEKVKPALIINAARATPPALLQGAVPLGLLEAAPADSPLIESIAKSTDSESPLYCIFTSGSTGSPKGVLVSHRSVINMAERFTETFGFDKNTVFGNQAPFDFDVSVKDIYIALKNGARAEILERQLFSAPKLLIERLTERGVNTAIWSVSAMKILSALKTFDKVLPKTLKTVMFSGETLPCKVLNDWKSHLPQARFVNLYGPTEITCNCTYYVVDRPFEDDDALPIGRAFDNMRVFLLADGREITDKNEAGEICVSGAGLALGYYNDPQKTAEVFTANPACRGWSEPIYRTGDIGRYNERGELMFAGRRDSQVKYMGFRIELGEIEIAANAISFISSACCLFDDKREQLCLFYQAEKKDDAAVRAALAKTLPRFMVPTRLYHFEKLPENRTGKIDRAALRREYIG